MLPVMSNTETDTETAAPGRDSGGRWIAGHRSKGGRPPGARNRLTESFLNDLKTVWEESGITALRACAKDEPAQFVRVVAGLLPRDLNINGTLDVGVDAQSVLGSFRAALETLGNEPPKRLPKIIDHAK